ncbi:hypothetical protein PIB30_080082, partial [Stylosanthes scabra]|nr:hypothetical protein [Stylosanthes scabra]
GAERAAATSLRDIEGGEIGEDSTSSGGAILWSTGNPSCVGGRHSDFASSTVHLSMLDLGGPLHELGKGCSRGLSSNLLAIVRFALMRFGGRRGGGSGRSSHRSRRGQIR